MFSLNFYFRAVQEELSRHGQDVVSSNVTSRNLMDVGNHVKSRSFIREHVFLVPSQLYFDPVINF